MKNLLITVATIGIVAIVIILLISSPEEDNVMTRDYTTYTNDRYGYEIEYPSSYTAQSESQSGDGQVFEGANGTLLVFALQNTGSSSLRAVAEDYTKSTESQTDILSESDQSVVAEVKISGTTRTAKAITLSNSAVGVAVFERRSGTAAETVNTIFNSFRSIVDETDDTGTDREADVGDDSG